jgi:hypothetical protein
VITTVGAEVYPLPAELRAMLVTIPPLTDAVAVAPVPPPPVKVTLGGEV